VVAAAFVGLLVSGCEFTGINSYPLPLTAGGDADDLRVNVILENATNLVPNSEVKFDEITIGSVRKIELENWHAVLTIGVDKDVPIPADVVAQVAQKSLLGAEYLELSVPGNRLRQRASFRKGAVLQSGDTIGLDRTGRYPETEEVLSAAALLFNGGGLPQLRVISQELNAALTGRNDDVRSLIDRLSVFTGTLDRQRDAIVAALGGLNRLSLTVSDQRGLVDRALTSVPRGVDTLTKERVRLVRTLESLSRFQRIASRVFNSTENDLARNLANLQPVTKALADSGETLAKSVDVLTFPFPAKSVPNMFAGDYLNLFVTFNVDVAELANTFLDGTPLDGLFTAFFTNTPTGPAVQNTNPLTDPLKDLLGGGKKNGPGAKPPLLGGLLDGLLGPDKGERQDTGGESSGDNTGGLLGGLLGGL
jgi:phospholipid/cholesterol/gamma-HCH transport system substrate-binding protein